MRRWVLVAVLLLGVVSIHHLAEGQQQPTRVLTRTDVNVTTVVTQLCPINGSRVDCSCTNNDAATAIRIGDSSITTTRGQRMPAGSTFKATTTSAVFGVSESGTVILSCADQSR